MALLTAIFIAMGQFNHAIHFYIYTLTGGVFRNELIKLLSFLDYRTARKPAANAKRTEHSTLLTRHRPSHLEIEASDIPPPLAGSNTR